MKTFLKRILLTILLFITIYSVKVDAGFGISPASINATNVIPGSNLNYEILISTSQTDNTILSITRDLGEIDEWIKINPAETIKISNDELFKKIQLVISIPENAVLKEYFGELNLYIQKDVEQPEGNSVRTGLKFDIRLNVSETRISKFLIRAINIPSIKMGSDINVITKIENGGNIDGTISQIELEVRNLDNKIINTFLSNSIGLIKAGTIEEVTTSFPNQLIPGEYFVTVKAMQNEQVLMKDNQLLKVFASDENNNGFTLGSIKNALNIQNISDIALMIIIVVINLLLFIGAVVLYVKYPKINSAFIGGLLWLFGISLLLSISILFYFSVEETKKFTDNSELIETDLSKTTNTDNIISPEIKGLSTNSLSIEKLTKENKNIYEAPSTGSLIIHSTRLNEKILIQSENGAWLKVEINGKEGYIAKDDIIR